jgi:hypothetical protein
VKLEAFDTIFSMGAVDYDPVAWALSFACAPDAAGFSARARYQLEMASSCRLVASCRMAIHTTAIAIHLVDRDCVSDGLVGLLG